MPQKKKLKILIIVSSLIRGGKERQILEMITGFAKYDYCDYKLLVLSKQNHFEDELKFINNQNLIFLDRESFIKTLLTVGKIIRNYRPDIIHNWDHYSTLTSFIFAFLMRIKLIDGSIRGAKIFLKRRIILPITLPFTSVLVANSRAGLASIGRMENNENRVIYNGVDLHRFDNVNSNIPELRNKYGISTKYVIGTIANFRSAKDYTTLIQAFNMIIKKAYDVTLLCIGYGELEGHLKKYIDDNNLKSKIKILGSITNVEKVIGLFDIGVLISNTNVAAEGISNSIIEYMASYKPVIATDSGGNNEIVHHGINGFIVAPFDKDELADRIGQLLDSKDLRDTMGKTGRKMIEQNFDRKLMMNNYLDLYKSLMSTK